MVTANFLIANDLERCPENEVEGKHCWSAWTSEILEFGAKGNETLLLFRYCAYCNLEQKA